MRQLTASHPRDCGYASCYHTDGVSVVRKWGGSLAGGRAHGMGLNRVHEAFCEVGIGIDAAIAQKRPVGPRKLNFFEVGGGYQDLFLGRGGALDDLAIGGGDEGLAPKL